MSLMKAAVLGCGYLGSEVAKLWRSRGIHVTATTRHPDKLQAVSEVAQKSLLIKGNDALEFTDLIQANDTILVSIGADRLEDYDHAYRQTAQMFRNLAIEMDLPRRLIYTSSTAVYDDNSGKFLDEESPLSPKTERAKILVETERLYQSLTELGWTVCILRLAEIYGPGRELSKRVKQNAGISMPGSGSQYTNMIHRSDCVGAIDYVLRHHLEGVFNLADDDHPTRKELYDAVAQKHGLSPLSWDPKLTGVHSTNKRVSNHKIKGEDFSFRFPHRVLD